MKDTLQHQATNLLLPICLSILVLFLNFYLSQPPGIVAQPASSTGFSALKAQNTLKYILDKQVPHPVGSPANKEVKKRIIEQLNSYGLEVTEQRVFACSRTSGSCAWVENVAARLNTDDKDSANPSITLMAHYDSVPMSPGAGDDGAGVAVILEIARLLSREEKPLNPVIFLFTDGEEFGLLGAEGYFNEHPWAKTTAVVLNLEGSGSSGPSNLLRTGHDNLELIEFFKASASHYAAQSLVTEVFKRMPNDTDFSVVQRANLQGMDFAFAEDRNHYHTPLDTIENLSLATVGHHGSNIFPLVRELANSRLEDWPSGDQVYQSLFGSVLITWNQTSTWLLLLTCISITVVILYLVRASYTVPQILTCLALVLMVILGVSLANYLTFKLVELSKGTMVSFPATTWPYYLLIAGSTLVGGILPVLRARRFQTYWSSALGLWIFWLVLACCLTLLAPVAANLIIIPTMAALLMLLVSCLLPRSERKPGWLSSATLNLLIVTPFTLGLVVPLVETQGLNLVFIVWLSLGLYMATMIPFIHLTHARSSVLVLAIGVVLVSGGYLAALFTPFYSPDKSQHINIYHVQDQDQKAWWMLNSPNPVPVKMAALYNFSNSDAVILPWQRQNSGPIAGAPAHALPPPLLTIVSEKRTQAGRELTLEFQSSRQANYGLILIPETVKLQSLSVEGVDLPITVSARLRQRFKEGYHRIHLAAVPAQGVRIQLVTTATTTFDVIIADWTSELPITAEELLKLRSPLGSPVHQGDQSLIFAHINI